jgi:DNA-directed RNA polymerase delta subunit
MTDQKKNQETPSSDLVTLYSETIEKFLERLPERSRAIVKARFGMDGGKAKTLEEIGSYYSITRERVRQVICSALEQLKKALLHEEQFSLIPKSVEQALSKKHGIMVLDELVKALSKGNKKEKGAILAFLEALPNVLSEKLSDDHEKVYFLKDFSLDAWQEMKDGAKNILTDMKETLSGEELYKEFTKKHGKKFSYEHFINFMIVSKDIKQNVFGRWGLATWSDIKPRGTREKAYLVLKTGGKPLHFRDIAKLIDEHGLHQKKRQSHPQTVHNELIKDKRFVLVGRGIYALSEWGYKKGTVKEVISEILKDAKEPLTREEILERVLSIRQVKKSTIIINLNTFFERVAKNTYTLKKK